MSIQKDIAGIRKDYKLQTLDEHAVAADPFSQFGLWWNEAKESSIEEVNAMTLATASPDGIPYARIVLLKSYDENGFVFFTNYNSNKARQLSTNPQAALIFFWKELERQVRIEGIVEKVSEADSEAYFQLRPIKSQLGAWASPQSTPIGNRSILEENMLRYEQEFGEQVPRPLHWGGYVVKPHAVEFWQGRRSRLHDRILYTLNTNGTWKKGRLAP